MKMQQLHEGPFDFLGGAAKHVGQQITQGVSNTLDAGKKSSRIADLQRAVAALSSSVDQYVTNKRQYDDAVAYANGQQQQNQQSENPAAPSAQAQQATPAAQQQTQQPQTTSNPMVTKKPKYKLNVDGSRHIQFDSYLQSIDNKDFITEGVWDFIKGAGTHAAKAIAEPIRQTVQAGKVASFKAEYEKAAVQVKASKDKVLDLMAALGEDGQDAFDQALMKLPNVSDARIERLTNFIKRAAEKRNTTPQ